MFIYEKDGKLNFEIDNHNQVPTTGTPDIVISKADNATAIEVDGTDIVSKESQSASESNG